MCCVCSGLTFWNVVISGQLLKQGVVIYPQWVSDPSVGPFPGIANANQRKPGSIKLSRNFIHWSMNGEGRAPALNAPSLWREGRRVILRFRRQACRQGSRKGAKISRVGLWAAGTCAVFQVSLHRALIVPLRVQILTWGGELSMVRKQR